MAAATIITRIIQAQPSGRLRIHASQSLPVTGKSGVLFLRGYLRMVYLPTETIFSPVPVIIGHSIPTPENCLL